MKKRLLMIGYNYAPEPTGIGKYSGEMIEWLARHGYDCTVITTYPYYPYWKVQEPYAKGRFWYKKETQYFDGGGRINLYRCPMYVPAKPSGLKRIMLDLSFILSASVKLIQLLPGKKFDFILSIVPSFLLGLPCIIYKKIQGAKLFYHIHDMQIEAARDLKMIKSDKLIDTLFKVEKFIFNQCDEITCVGDGMVRKTQQKVSRKINLFPNWTDLKDFYPIEDKGQLKAQFGFEVSDKIILYSGAIGEKQGLEVIFHAAKKLQVIKTIKFLICGSGPYREKLEKLAQDLKLTNVFFCPLQPKGKFNLFLNIADVHLVIQKASACDLVMPSKLTTILAVGGLAVVTANRGSGLYAVVDKHEIGILTDAESSQALLEGILRATDPNNNYIRKNARRYAEKYLAIDAIMGAFEHRLQESISIPVSKGKVPAKDTIPTSTPIVEQEMVYPITDQSLKKFKPAITFLGKDRPIISMPRKGKDIEKGETDGSPSAEGSTGIKNKGKSDLDQG